MRTWQIVLFGRALAVGETGANPNSCCTTAAHGGNYPKGHARTHTLGGKWYADEFDKWSVWDKGNQGRNGDAEQTFGRYDGLELAVTNTRRTVAEQSAKIAVALASTITPELDLKLVMPRMTKNLNDSDTNLGIPPVASPTPFPDGSPRNGSYPYPWGPTRKDSKNHSVWAQSNFESNMLEKLLVVEKSCNCVASVLAYS